ncbi:MAG: hypothetical protein M0019_00400 [Actinomycetota bacterium]|nr:hypothetical protein [Actinomycetota bacterium]
MSLNQLDRPHLLGFTIQHDVNPEVATTNLFRDSSKTPASTPKAPAKRS